MNKDLRPGQTIVVGTQAGLFARVHRLERAVLVVRSTKNDGSVELAELPMDADVLAEVGLLRAVMHCWIAKRIFGLVMVAKWWWFYIC